jgi:hypothetical protein
MCEPDWTRCIFHSRKEGNFGYRASLALREPSREKNLKKMLCDTNRLYDPSQWPSAAAIRQGIAVNLAAFGGALVAFVAALRGTFNPNSLPR